MTMTANVTATAMRIGFQFIARSNGANGSLENVGLSRTLFSGRGIADTERRKNTHGLVQGFCSQLVAQTNDLRLDGANGDDKFARDFLLRFADGNSFEDLRLPFTEFHL